MPDRSLFRCGLVWAALAVLVATCGHWAVADEPDPSTVAAGSDDEEDSGSSRSSSSSSAPRPKFPPHSTVLRDFEPVEGDSLLQLYRKGNLLYAELTPGQLNRDMIVLISIARGIGEGSLLAGMTWGFGDDWLWQFRRVDDNIQVVRRNVRFRAAPGSPEQRAVDLAYTDSVLYSLPIETMGPSGGVVIDLTPIFMSDLPQISSMLPGFSFSASRSSWAEVKGFEDNVELEVAATYASSGMLDIDSVPDSRGVSVNVHYSISMLPETGYRPRLADDRVGYFLTVIKDFSKKADEERFVRYINRWDLQKAEPDLDLSPPKRPIVFWIEKTVPYQFRKPIREGILEWNKAFEEAGFANAIEVRQQPDDADWDPEDIHYNTFRWITAGAGFAMGPSRVNPKTGQILDADIIFDADFINFWKQEYETFTAESVAALTGGPLDIQSYLEQQERIPLLQRHASMCQCELHAGRAREMALGSIALLATADAEARGKELEKLIMQGLKEIAMHEVGHTLGLRHNFKASTYFTLDELNDPSKTAQVGLGASVMDYNPTNLVPKGKKQGDYFSGTIGPYDMWAIEYGYASVSGGSPEGELKELRKIAAKTTEAGLSFATDEDTRGIDPDPLSNRFDLGKDPIEYARQRTTLVSELWPDVIDRVTEDGEGYQRGRQAFGILLGNHGTAVFTAARYIGGLYVSRDHKGDPNERPAFQVVEAKKQRDALELVLEQALSEKPFSFPPELYGKLASSWWSHWGTNYPLRTDYAAHDVILLWQDRILDQLLSSTTLTRLHDSELKVAPDEDAFSVAELMDKLTDGVFSELDDLDEGEYTPRQPAINSLRRNLQRSYLKRLGDMALGSGSLPEDCQTLAYAELSELESDIEKALDSDVDLDAYSEAHLRESAARIRKVLDASISTFRP